MKLVHLSDLHLGKRVNEFSMIEDQAYILRKIISIIDEEKADGVMIAGDVYDKSIPPLEAVSLFDNFLTLLSKRKIPVFIISGNHDSAERVSFGSDLMKASSVYFSPAYDGNIQAITINQNNEIDQFGPINIYMLPYIKPALVKAFLKNSEEGEAIQSYTHALSYVINSMKIDSSVRNVLIAHQFVTGAITCDSEDLSVGGSDNVDVEVFDAFDYVALGHLHGPQKVGREDVRYCGTPLKYSFSEVNHKKALLFVELGEKGQISYKSIPLEALHDMREIKGTYEEVTLLQNYQNTKTDDYMSIILTDEDEIPQAFGKLQAIYKNLMKLTYDNQRSRLNKQIENLSDIEKISPIDIFSTFYEEQNNRPMDEFQQNFVKSMIEKIWEDE